MNFQLQIISYFIALSDSETKNSKLVIVIICHVMGMKNRKPHFRYKFTLFRSFNP